MAYSVSFLFQLKVQLVRTIAHAPSSSSTVVSVGFFEDMWIPLVHLPQPCALYASFYSPSLPIHLHAPRRSLLFVFAQRSDPNERAYFWLPSSEATSTHELLDSPESERLYIDQGEIVRVRVERDEFCDDEPGPPKATEGGLISGQVQPRRLPYTVTVSPQPFCDGARPVL